MYPLIICINISYLEKMFSKFFCSFLKVDGLFSLKKILCAKMMDTISQQRKDCLMNGIGYDIITYYAQNSMFTGFLRWDELRWDLKNN